MRTVSVEVFQRQAFKCKGASLLREDLLLYPYLCLGESSHWGDLVPPWSSAFWGLQVFTLMQ